MKKLLLLDSSNIIFRSFYGWQQMYNSRAEHIGAIYGFIDSVFKLISLYQPDYCVAAFDKNEAKIRRQIDPKYKLNREPTPLEIIPQFQIVRDFCEALGIKCYEGGGYEADDWIASCATQYLDVEIYIVSTDKDLLQLVNDRVFIHNPMHKTKLGRSEVLERWGVLPEQIGDMLALTGDTSDNVEGARGVGPKTAAIWLKEYDNLQNILFNACKLKPLSRGTALITDMDKVIKAKQLVSLYKDLQIDELHQCTMQLDRVKLETLLTRYEIKKTYNLTLP